MYLEEFLPSLTAHLLWRPDSTRDFKLLKKCSIGERGTALLSVILITGREPLIIDQPEDDLDHFYLYKTLTPIIKEVKKRRQLIFATHDANIVINGDTELILITTTRDGKFGEVILTSIENLNNREDVMKVLEGGKDAFRKRREKYGKTADQNLFPQDMNEEKELQEEIKEKLESEGIDPDELDEDEQEKLADLL